MNPVGAQILDALRAVQAERAVRLVDPSLGLRVTAVKAWQHQRFAHSHADLLAHPRYGAAARFFLDDLYGPRDFSERDAQFQRVVPALVRLFPPELVGTVRALAELHALSEQLDSGLARHIAHLPLDAASYGLAWRAFGHAPQRAQQIELVLQVGQALDVYTRNPLLRQSLRLMRGPARVAGLADLQRFLETGFDTFAAMHGAQDFMASIAARERAEVQRLFNQPPPHDNP